MTVSDSEDEELDESRLWAPAVADSGDTAASEDEVELVLVAVELVESVAEPEPLELVTAGEGWSGVNDEPEGAAVWAEPAVLGSELAIAVAELSVLAAGGLEIWGVVSAGAAVGSVAGALEG